MSKTQAKKRKHAKKKPQTSTALVRRQPTAIRIMDPMGMMPPPNMFGPVALTNHPMVNAQSIGTLKLSGDQIAALRRPVADEELDWKPTFKDGPADMPYLSHNGYRDRLDEAFGLGGWGMMPTAMPAEKDGVVYAPFALVVDGQARFHAIGVQEYHPNNKQMNYGDALEGAKSNAIMRCAKELGIARELWDKKNLAKIRKRCLNGGGGAEPGTSRPLPPRPPAATRHAHQSNPISDNQYGRLLAIIKAAGRTKSEVLAYLSAFYGIKTWEKVKTSILRTDYDAICAAIEKRGDLPVKPDPATPVRTPDAILDADDIPWGDEQ